MEKILFLDFSFFRGHHNLNVKFLEIFCKRYEVQVISKKGYYSALDKLKLRNVNFIEPNLFFIDNKHGPLIGRFKIAIIMLITTLKLRKGKEKTFIVGYEHITFGLLGRFFWNNNTYLLHHQNIDELKNKIKYKVFNIYKNKVNHVVLDQFITKYLQETIEIDKEKIFYINHPISHGYKTVVEYQDVEFNKIIIVGLSGSNDEKKIENLIKESKSGRFNISNNFKLVLKSKKFYFKSENLIVFNEYLAEEAYDNYIKNAFGFLLLFSNDFNHRMSGTLIDALKNKRIVFGADIPCVRVFNERYPKICHIISDFNDIEKIANSKWYDNTLDCEFEKFLESHSDNIVIKQFDRIFGE